jgi:hypothetical protein
MKTGVQSISRRLITTSLILSIYLSFSSSSIWLATAEDNLCEPLPIDSAEHEFELGTSAQRFDQWIQSLHYIRVQHQQ